MNQQQQQRIVLKMDMSDSEKSIKKAMKIASAKAGVRSVSIQGRNDQLVLLGEGIDLAELTRELKKKVCHTSIITVQAAPPQRPPQPHTMGQYNEMPPAIRCTCEIPNSGFCVLCRSMSQQHTYQMVPSPYPPPVFYCRDEPDSCRIL